MSEDLKQRVKIEKEELEDKMVSLGTFIGSTQFYSLGEVDQILLKVQLTAMKGYLDALVSRIRRF